MDFRRFYGLNFGRFAQDDGAFREEDHPRAPGGGSKGGQFTSGGGSGAASSGKGEGKQLKEDTGREGPAPGEKFTVYRAGKEGEKSLAGRNGGTSKAVAAHLARLDDVDKPQYQGQAPTHVHAYEVSANKAFGEYKLKKGEADGEGVGRKHMSEGHNTYSFENGGFTERLLGSVPIEEVKKILNGNFDDSGSIAGGEAIAKVIQAVVEKEEKTRKPSTAAELLFKSTYDPKVTVDDVLAGKPAHAKEALAGAKRRLEGVVPTDAPVDKGGYKMANGQYTPEREKVQRSILEKTFSDEAVKAATPAAGEKPIASFIGGRGGSGKSWFTRPGGPIDAGKAIVLNSDFFKEALPEYEGWNAAQVHEESSDLLDQALDIAKRKGLNIVLDATMRSEGGIGRYVSDFRAAGYKLQGYYMHTSPQEAASRALDRFLRGGSKGRYVPPELVLGSTTNEKVFDKVSSFMHKWAIYDNNAPGGNSPKFVAEGENADE